MDKIKFKQVVNVVKIEDCENKELIGKKFIIEFSPLFECFKKKFLYNRYYYILEDEILNDNNEVVGYLKEIK